MKTTNDFFIPDNEVKFPEELDYSCADEYIRSAEAFSQYNRPRWRLEACLRSF